MRLTEKIVDRSAEQRWGSSWRILRNIVRDEGHFSALYRGLMPNMIGNSVSWALYFLWYMEPPRLVVSKI